MSYQSIKTYGHDVGLSAVFRQWRAESHCNRLHGYALAVIITFECDTLDSRHWVVDFGAMKEVKEWLQSQFDHKLIMAADDPLLHKMSLDLQRVAHLVVMPQVGCEAFAQYIHTYVNLWIGEYLESIKWDGLAPPEGLHCLSVEVREHGGNGAKYCAD